LKSQLVEIPIPFYQDLWELARLGSPMGLAPRELAARYNTPSPDNVPGDGRWVDIDCDSVPWGKRLLWLAAGVLATYVALKLLVR